MLPVAGVNIVVKLVFGDVFVKLLVHVLVGFRDLCSLLQERDFVPLKGVVLLLVGIEVDVCKGTLQIDSVAIAVSKGVAC